MSDGDVTTWMNKLRDAVWQSMGETAPDVLNVVALKAASIIANRKPGVWGNPNRTSNLMNAIMGAGNSEDLFSNTESEIVSERIINLPYARIIEQGGATKVFPKMAGIFLRLYHLTGDKKYKNAYASAKYGLKTEFNHLAHPYIEPAYQVVNAETLERLLRPHLEKELSKIGNLEVVIGD